MLNKETLNKIETTFGSFKLDTSSKYPFLRFGYWNKINETQLQSIIGNEYIIVDEDYDDEGVLPRYYYRLIKK
jgi:hypothetical protein